MILVVQIHDAVFTANGCPVVLYSLGIVIPYSTVPVEEGTLKSFRWSAVRVKVLPNATIVYMYGYPASVTLVVCLNLNC